MWLNKKEYERLDNLVNENDVLKRRLYEAYENMRSILLCLQMFDTCIDATIARERGEESWQMEFPNKESLANYYKVMNLCTMDGLKKTLGIKAEE